MKKQSQFPYKLLQKIKAQEFRHFFEKSQIGRYPFLNHLGEIIWMTPEEAELQHEYYEYQPGFSVGLKRKLSSARLPRLEKMGREEKELRLQFRKYLEEKYLGTLTAETAALLPQTWANELSVEEIENIPVTLEILESVPWPRSAMLLAVAVIIAAAAIAFSGLLDNRQPTGSIVVEANVRGAGIFLDDSKRGYADFMRMLADIPVGKHQVRVEKPGYVSTPHNVEVEVLPDSVISLYFNLQQASRLELGYLRIVADHPDSKVFINGDFHCVLTDQPVIPLEEGQYRVALERENYRTDPAEILTRVNKGDTTVVEFTQTSNNTVSANTGIRSGALNVSSNVSGAMIYLNGRNTGKAANHFFSELPFGNYTVRVEKEGYRVEPKERHITLSRSNARSNAYFDLSPEFENAIIRVTPATAEIFIDGKRLGAGLYQGPVPLGKHRLSFGAVDGYKTPPDKEITVTPNIPLSVKVEYFPEIRMVAEVSSNGNLNIGNCDFVNGYTVGNRGFTASEEAGPEIVYNEQLDNYYWKFGYAFPYRTPRGNDAVRLSFMLPQKVNYDHKFVLRFEAAMSKERYPLAISRKTDVQIKLNHKILSYYYQPKFMEDLNGLETIEWDITSQVKPGLNNLIITLTDKNNSYFYLKRISISN